jgi:hypothetical protein
MDEILTERISKSRRRRDMAKLAAALLIIASFLLAAPVIESGTLDTQFFQALGTADGGGQ